MKKILLVFIILAICQVGFSQNVCGTPPSSRPGCLMCSPVISSNNSNGGSGGTDCGSGSKGVYMHFIADNSGSFSGTLISSCGLVMSIFDGATGEELTCFGGSPVTGSFSLGAAVPGRMYIFLVWGPNSAVCDFTVVLSSGADFLPPPSPGPISADPQFEPLCPNVDITYSVAPNSVIDEFVWTVPANGTIVSGQGTNSIVVNYTGPGGGVVRVAGAATCQPGIPTVLPVTITLTIPQIAPIMTFCQEEFPVIVDNHTFDAPGSYTIEDKDINGCDSVLTYNILTKIQVPNIIDSMICQGQTVMIGNQIFDESGSYEVIIPNAAVNGCDSIVKLSLIVTDQFANLSADTLLACNQLDTIDLAVLNVPTNSSIQWRSILNGNILTNTTDSLIKVDSAGTYVVEVLSNGCVLKDTIEVTRKGAPVSPVLDTLIDNQCNLDSLVIQLDSMAGTDSLLWNFVGLDTFKTEFLNQLVYYPTARYDTLRVFAENECGLGLKLDTTLRIRPSSLPEMVLNYSDVCIHESVEVIVSPVDSNVTLQWQIDGGVLYTTPDPNRFNIAWQVPGFRTIQLFTNQDSCSSFPDEEVVEVYEPYADLDLTCQSSTGAVTFSWTSLPNALFFRINVLTGQMGTVSGTASSTQYTVTGLSPNEEVTIELIPEGFNPCGSRSFTRTCSAQDCPPVSVDIDPVQSVCIGDRVGPKQLNANLTGTNGNGTYEWSGSGVSNGFFDANQAGVGTHQIRLLYSENGCYYIDFITTTVFANPDAEFNSSGSNCQGETMTLTYSGNFGRNLNFNWDVGDGIIISGANSSTVEVEFQNPGLKNISLTTEANGCFSQPVTNQIMVDRKLNCIQEFCSSTSTSVTFEWVDDPFVADYLVTNLSGGNGSLLRNSYTVTGLNPSDVVRIEIIAISGNSCGDETLITSCKADPCPVLPPFTINCSSSLRQIVFNWLPVPGAVDYQVASSTGHSGQLVGTEYVINNLGPDETVEIEVTAIGALSCSRVTSSQSCTTTDCPLANTQIAAVPDFCEGEPSYQILLTNTNGLTNVRWSGDVDATGNFNPNLPGNFTATVDFEIDNCSYNLSTSLTVYQNPSADFLLSNNEVCQSEIITAEYIGNATPNANYNWNFDQANVLNSTSSVFYELEYPTPGTQEVSLMVEENGCFSTTETQTIQIDERLIEPFINCNVTTNKIEFTWDDVRNSSGYQIDIISGQSGIQNGNSYVFENLNINEEVTIEITANSANNCPSTQSQKTCITKDCPPRGLAISPVTTTYCEGDVNTYQLEATIDGVQIGSYIWSGVGVSSTGEFSPANLVAGDYNISVAYEEAGCFYSQTINLTIEPNPVLNLTVNSPIWRLNDVGSINVNPSGGTPPYELNWNNGSTQNQLSDLNIGTYCVTLTDENGCEEIRCEEISEGNYIVKPIHVICPRDFLRLDITPRSGADFEWSPTTGLSCGTCPNPFVSLQKTNFYDVKATLPSGQSESTRVMVVVLPQVICSFKKEAPENWDFVLADLDLNNLTEKDIQKVEKRIIEYYQRKEVNIYPNPTDGQLTIDSSYPFNLLEIFDMSGRRVMKTKSRTVDLSNQTKGIYFFKVVFENEAIVKRVVLN